MELLISNIIPLALFCITISGIIARIFQTIILGKVKEMIDKDRDMCVTHQTNEKLFSEKLTTLSNEIVELKALMKEMIRKQSELSERLIKLETKIEDK